MDLLKRLSFLFIFFTFVFPIHAFDVDEFLDGDGLSSGFTHFLRIGIKTDIVSFLLEGDAQIFDKQEREVGKIQGQLSVSAEHGGIKVGSKVFKDSMLKFT